MVTSLEVPTATSVRAIPAKLLIDNRVVINSNLARARGGKVSFTHLIGYAVIRALAQFPSMNVYYDEIDGKPVAVQPAHVNFGIAIDMPKPDGTRLLMVPNIKKAETLNFSEFWHTYEDLIKRARNGKLTADDHSGTTVSLTNPGGIGTVHSVPRLSKGQAAIIGVGALDYPAEFQGASEKIIAQNAISKVLTLTSTYDHRVIQGAGSGEFLKLVHQLLLGAQNFYDEIFESLRIPYEPVRWSPDLQVDPADEINKVARIQQLIHAYRVRGHLMADTDPLEYVQRKHPDLDVLTYGLTLWDLDREWPTGGFGGKPMLKFRDILGVLRDAYCRTTGIEYMHIQDPAERKWFQDQLEHPYSKPSRDEQLRIVSKLNAAEAFETFLQTKFVGQKRFSLEGGESLIPLLDAIISDAADDELDEVAIGMAHRGRLNVLTNIAGKTYAQVFREFEGTQDPRSVQGSGDVKYHLGTEGTFTSDNGKETKVYLAANPSHLEAVDSVLEGIVRAKQDRLDQGEAFPVLPIMVHGDAAFAGQGVVAETLNLSQLRGYRTGGTIHIVVNNQVGFTTAPSSSRSSTYSTDVAKMIQAPVFHVNGDDPEAVVRIGQLAYEFRQRFHKDVVIDMVCYRRRGHNEGDDPSMTQPLMYNLIEAKRSVRKLYTESLIGRGDITEEEAEQLLRDYQERLERVFAETHAAQTSPIPIITADSAAVSDLERPMAQQSDSGVSAPASTAISAETLARIGKAHVEIPEGFTVHAKLKQLLEKREADVPRRRHRLGLRRARGLRLAHHGRRPGPARRPGLAPRHLRAAPRRLPRPRQRRRVAAAGPPLRRPGQAVDLRLAALRIRGHGLRIRLLRRAPGRPGALGSAVRRLRQRRADHHRRVHLLGRAEVGPALLAGADAAARLRRPGPGPLLRPHRALPADVRRREHDRGQPHDAGLALPPAAPPGLQPAAQAADHLHAEAAAPPQGRGILGGGLHHGHLPAGHPRARAAAGGRRRTRAAGLRPPVLRSAVHPAEDRGQDDGDRARRAALPAAGRRDRRRAGQVPERRGGLGAGRAGQPGSVAVHRAEPAGRPGPPRAPRLPSGLGFHRGRVDEAPRGRAGRPAQAGIRT